MASWDELSFHMGSPLVHLDLMHVEFERARLTTMGRMRAMPSFLWSRHSIRKEAHLELDCTVVQRARQGVLTESRTGMTESGWCRHFGHSCGKLCSDKLPCEDCMGTIE